MTTTEKLLAHLENILPRHDWELHRDAITKIMDRLAAEHYMEGVDEGWRQCKEGKTTEEKP